jgi:hypothetical protein
MRLRDPSDQRHLVPVCHRAAPAGPQGPPYALRR